MSGMLRFLGLSVPVFCGLGSCMVMRTAETGYPPARIVQDGAAYEGALMAEGAGSALAVSAMIVGGGSVSLTGPYRPQITAYGFEGVHRRFDIRSLRIRFPDGKTHVFGPEQILGSPWFSKGDFQGEAVAVRRLARVFSTPPLRGEGPVIMEADALLDTKDGRRREKLKFAFTPGNSVHWENVNIPWEIKKSLWRPRREHPVTAWAPGGE